MSDLFKDRLEGNRILLGPDAPPPARPGQREQVALQVVGVVLFICLVVLFFKAF